MQYLLNLSAPMLAPLRVLWRFLRSFQVVKRYVERRLLYPSLPHIHREAEYRDGPWLVAGFFRSAHGIGEAARLELARLRLEGHEAWGVDIGEPFDLCDIKPPRDVLPLSEAPDCGPLVLHCNAPEAGRALVYLGKRLTEHRRIIGFWAWELEVPPHDWERAYAYIDELWVPSRHTAKAFAAAPVPVRIHPHVVRLAQTNRNVKLDLPPSLEGKRLFLCMADGRSDLVRKNILGVVRAFGRALGDDRTTGLVVKLHHTSGAGPELSLLLTECSRYANVHVVDCLYSKQERDALLRLSDVVVSLHRAEGFGLLLAEALALGKRIIATNYSGPTDFLNARNSALIPYTLIPIESDTRNYAGYAGALWAEPDEEAAVAAMRAAARS